jgi:hypothetical protein
VPAGPAVCLPSTPLTGLSTYDEAKVYDRTKCLSADAVEVRRYGANPGSSLLSILTTILLPLRLITGSPASGSTSSRTRSPSPGTAAPRGKPEGPLASAGELPIRL